MVPEHLVFRKNYRDTKKKIIALNTETLKPCRHEVAWKPQGHWSNDNKRLHAPTVGAEIERNDEYIPLWEFRSLSVRIRKIFSM